MPSTREARAVAQIACPRCKVPAGVPCIRRPGSNSHGPLCHPERRQGNQERIRAK
jgi:hypothetical protein